MRPPAKNPARTATTSQRASKSPTTGATRPTAGTAAKKLGVPHQRSTSPRHPARRFNRQTSGPLHQGPPQAAGAAASGPPLTPKQLYAARLRTLRQQRRTETRKVLAWTTLGWLVPGMGLLRAGALVSGTLLTCISVLGPLLLLTLFLLGELPTLMTTFATSPRLLDLAALASLAAGTLWILITIATFFSLRSIRLTVPQNLTCLATLCGLIAASIVPVGGAAHLMHTNSTTLSAVFDHSTNGDAPNRLPTEGDPWAGTNRVNILLIGSDAGHDRTGTRPDSIVVASIEPHTGDTVLLSLPRNLVAPQFAHGTTGRRAWPQGFAPETDPHLNAVWAWAENNADLFPGKQRPGLTATQHAVEGSLGISIDYWVMVDLRGFEDVVDALGGLEMTVGQRIAIAKSDDPAPSEWIEPGRQHLTGYQALWFGRSRWGGDDYLRMRRQRCLLGALTAQADPASVARALPALSRAAEQHVATSIPAADIPAFVILAERMKSGQMTSLAFTNKVITPSNPSYPSIRRLTQAALYRTPAPATPSASGTGKPATGSGQDSRSGSGTRSGSSGRTSTGTAATQPRPEALAEVCSA